MALTRYGVCYDLAGTPFTCEWGGIEFHFSTRAHQEKFMDSVSTRVHWLNDSLGKRFRVPVDAGDLAAVQLYQMIENRGFHVVMGGEVFTCPAGLVFRGRLRSASDSRTRSVPSTEQLLG